MKAVVSLLKTVCFPVTDLPATLTVVCVLTLVEDVGWYHSWITVAGAVLLNFLVVRLLCWSLVTSIVLVIDTLHQDSRERRGTGARFLAASQMGSSILENIRI